MTVVVCGHGGAVYGAIVCTHLREPHEQWVKYAKWFIGVGFESELLCPACLALRERGEEVAVIPICGNCHDSLVDAGDLQATRGSPEIRERLEPIDLSLIETPLPRLADGLLDIASVVSEPGVWIVLGRDGMLVRLDANAEGWDELGVAAIPTEPDHKPWMNRPLTPRLHVSSRGEFAAVVNDYGRLGVVYDLRTARRTLQFDGGHYHANTVPSSFAFVEHNARSVAIYRTAWNRLDASDAATGHLLTERGPTSYKTGEARPDHYLDYFHGRLSLSPDGNHILDDGWVWHPVGMPAIWNTRVWLDANPWESEDGSSRQYLAHRDYYWDHAMCWLDARCAAIGGIGDDDIEMYDGARLFAADKPTRVLAEVTGPGGTFFSDGLRLFSANHDGLSVWDVEDGARTARLDGFRPTRQHSGSRELVEVSGPVLRRWRY